MRWPRMIIGVPRDGHLLSACPGVINRAPELLKRIRNDLAPPFSAQEKIPSSGSNAYRNLRAGASSQHTKAVGEGTSPKRSDSRSGNETLKGRALRMEIATNATPRPFAVQKARGARLVEAGSSGSPPAWIQAVCASAQVWPVVLENGENRGISRP